MHILALETSIEKMKAPFLHPDERELLLFRRHFLQFGFYSIPWVLSFLAYAAILAYIDTFYPLSMEFMTIALGSALATTLFILFLLHARTRYDFIFFTIDKLVVINSSLLHRSTIPINLNNVTAVSSETQFWDIFPFGVLRIKVINEAKTELVDEVSQKGDPGMNMSDIIFRYAPKAPIAAAKINDIITDFQRRKMNIAAPLLQESTNAQQRLATHKSLADKHAEVVTKELVPEPESKEDDNKKEEDKNKHLREASASEDQQRRRMLQY